MRFLVDDYGFGAEVEGLSGPEVVYLARKPKEGFALHREHYRERLEGSGDHVGIRSTDLPRGQFEDAGVAFDAPGE